MAKPLFLCAFILLIQVCLRGQTQSRHNLSEAEYIAEFDKWTKQDYRLIHICGYDNGRYAAIFHQARNTPDWYSFHKLTFSQYQDEFDNAVKKGFRPVKVSGYTIGSTPFYAVIFEKRNDAGDIVASHRMSESGYQAEVTRLKKDYIPADLSAYALNNKPHFAAIFEKNKRKIPWEARHDLTDVQYKAEFNKWDKAGYRLELLCPYPVGNQIRYAAVWTKRPIMKNWATCHGADNQAYQDEFERMHYQGYRLTWVNGVTVNGKRTYSAIWEERTGFKAREMQKADKLVKKFMDDYNVPGLSFAVAKDERLVLVKTYGFADEETSERVAPRHRFRVASLSKPITATGIMYLKERDQLDLGRTVFGNSGVLGTTYGTQPYGTNIEKITITHLLNHSCGGWAGSLGYDPMFEHTSMGHADLISKILDTRPLDKEPGKEYHYSNFGYCLLGRIIEKVSGKGYEAFVKEYILEPCGIKNMEIGGDTESERKVNEVKYYGQGEDPYGMKVKRMDAHGGWIATPVDLLRFMVRVDGFSAKPDILKPESLFNMFTVGVPGSSYAKGWGVSTSGTFWHTGSFDGGESVFVRTADGYCLVIVMNTRSSNSMDKLGELLWALKANFTVYPDYDLF